MEKQMSIIGKLASLLDVRSDEPNKDLAKEIVESNNQEAVRELIGNLDSKIRGIQSDCIKTLYEIGYLNADMIAPYQEVFLKLLHHKNNRLVWGGMIALDCVTAVKPEVIFPVLDQIIDVAQQGTVITKDAAFHILIKLGDIKTYQQKVFPLMMDELMHAPANQFPSYAEHVATVICGDYATEFVNILDSRLPLLEKESRKKRVSKVIKQLSNRLSDK